MAYRPTLGALHGEKAKHSDLVKQRKLTNFLLVPLLYENAVIRNSTSLSQSGYIRRLKCYVHVRDLLSVSTHACHLGLALFFLAAPAKAPQSKSVGGVVRDVIQVVHGCRTQNPLTTICLSADVLFSLRLSSRSLRSWTLRRCTSLSFRLLDILRFAFCRRCLYLAPTLQNYTILNLLRIIMPPPVG